ncbi:sucrose-6-phosphate hydrolase [Alkalihalobacillus hwajinpoensis]|uniref:glycoside hydrolase family 32 protein n=1 Tax=Guptibacillus hwajinpoensis TaxID=208199 RepID=UPI0018833DB7|nr:sucrose-6-phosphate hydrolase [Pseudalkalibacillus hwajinpoensis]MBF0705060.1 sucrose-6-phosphate hydrolase [Pseudalkalibacillus hwajinpoensis]
MTDRNEQLKDLAMKEIEAQRETVESDYRRSAFHLMPPAGLLNDPNGFIQWKGVYHVFFQWMPFKTDHGAKFWGHYTSTDLINWELAPIALAPGDWYDKNGCYSGSAVVSEDKLMLFYTGNVKDEQGNRETYQCLAESEDGIHFDKKGVVLNLPEGYTPHFRDPKVWQHLEKWYMVVGTQNLNEEGRVALFESTNLKDWMLKGDVTASGEEPIGDLGFMWECPDLFELDGKDILLFSPQGLKPTGYLYQNVYQTGYLSGEMNYVSGKMNHGSFTELDRGFEFYAPQSTLDENGRRLMIGWMGVPEQGEEHHPTIEHKWIHMLTIPRELYYEGDKLIQRPVKELEAMRQNEVKKEITLSNEEKEWEEFHGTTYELLLHVQKVENSFAVNFRNNAEMIYDADKGILTFKRKSFVDGKDESRSCSIDEVYNLRFYVDSSSIEVFVNDGEEVFTSRFFPEEHDVSLTFKSNGYVDVQATKWLLEAK